MAVDFVLEVEGLEEALRLYDPARLREALGKALLSGALFLEGPVKEGTPVDTGRLRASVRSGMVDWDRAHVFSDVHYAPYVETGTRPHFPPVDALAGWAHRHGIDEPFLVARAIAQRGTRGARMFARAAEEHGAQAIEVIARALREGLEGRSR